MKAMDFEEPNNQKSRFKNGEMTKQEEAERSGPDTGVKTMTQ